MNYFRRIGLSDTIRSFRFACTFERRRRVACSDSPRLVPNLLIQLLRQPPPAQGGGRGNCKQYVVVGAGPAPSHCHARDGSTSYVFTAKAVTPTIRTVGTVVVACTFSGRARYYVLTRGRDALLNKIRESISTAADLKPKTQRCMIEFFLSYGDSGFRWTPTTPTVDHTQNCDLKKRAS
jgi:hypothetical protein